MYGREQFLEEGDKYIFFLVYIRMWVVFRSEENGCFGHWNREQVTADNRNENSLRLWTNSTVASNRLEELKLKMN